MKKLTTEEFIKRAKLVHGDKYDYSKVDYVNSHLKVKIICPEHGVFEQKSGKHCSGQGCRLCSYVERSLKTDKSFIDLFRKTTEDFILDAKRIHGDKYNYYKTIYGANRTVKVVITCLIHGDFQQRPDAHLQGKGCPECGKIKNIVNQKKFHLNKRNWNFEQPKDYKLIPLTQGKFAKVDNEDFERLKDINWQVIKQGYASSGTVGLMHRYIMNAPDYLEVDHKEHDKLDNRKCNLRLASRSQNSANKPPREGSSKYKGVCWDKRYQKWVSYIKFNYNKYFLGYFNTEEIAAQTTDKKALECWGEFAYLNFPEKKEEYLKQIKDG